MSRSVLFSLFCCFSFYSFSQNLTCEDFKEGVFVTSSDEPAKIEYEITRKGNEQVEVLNYIAKDYEKFLDSKSRKVYAKIKWINDCSYNLTFDTTKGTPDEISKYINENGGVNTEIIKIEGRCFFYKSSMKVNGIERVINGKLCKKE
jgi:hypothetical protein